MRYGPALEQHLTYADLKTAARNAIRYSFLPEAEKAEAAAALERAFGRWPASWPAPAEY